MSRPSIHTHTHKLPNIPTFGPLSDAPDTQKIRVLFLYPATSTVIRKHCTFKFFPVFLSKPHTNQILWLNAGTYILPLDAGRHPPNHPHDTWGRGVGCGAAAIRVVRVDDVSFSVAPAHVTSSILIKFLNLFNLFRWGALGGGLSNKN